MGRMGLYELLSVTEAFKDKVTKEPNLTGLRRQAVIDGMRPLRLAEGVTTIEDGSEHHPAAGVMLPFGLTLSHWLVKSTSA